MHASMNERWINFWQRVMLEKRNFSDISLIMGRGNVLVAQYLVTEYRFHQVRVIHERWHGYDTLVMALDI